MDDPWLTAKAVGERLSLHPDTVRILLRQGRLRGHRINGRWRVRASEVDRFVTEGGKLDRSAPLPASGQA